MKPKTYTSSYCFTNLIILFVIPKISTQSILRLTNNAFIQKCTVFTDTRSVRQEDTESVLIIPVTRTSQIAYSFGEEPIALKLKEAALLQSLKCPMDEAEGRSFPWKLDNNISTPQQRNFHDVSSGSSARHQHSYFTKTGHFYDNITGNYYQSDGDYCVNSISDEGINLHVCVANGDCSSTSTTNTYCLPKCCALDETLLFWKRQCVRLPETQGRTPWQPSIYEGPQNPQKMVESNPNIIYHMAQLPQNCHLVEINETYTDNMYRWSSAAHVKHPMSNKSSQENDHIKLVLPENLKNGKIQLMSLFYGNRTWQVENYSNFCVEGFHVKSKDGSAYTGSSDNYVVFYCPNEGGEVDHREEEQQQNHQKWKSWLQVAASLMTLLFLLLTILIYVVLWDKHNLHGLIILSYTGSTFGSYFFLTFARLVSLFPSLEMVTGLHSRGHICYTIAILAHYFYLSSSLWLTNLNVDLWMSLKSFRVVSRKGKEWLKYGVYSGLGWVLPTALLVAFVTIDEVYRDPATGVPVPDYAMQTCFVSPDFRGQYVYTPMAIMLAINIVLIGMTMWIIVKARSQTTTLFNTGGVANTNTYDAKLFEKLFLVMGGTSFVDFLTWYYNNKGFKPWPIVVLEIISYFTPVALFFIFCLNDKIMGHLRERFPLLKKMRGRGGLKVCMKDEDGDSDPGSVTSNKSDTSNLDTTDRKKDVVPMSTMLQAGPKI